MSSIEIVDRRGRNKEDRQETPSTPADTEKSNVLAFTPPHNGDTEPARGEWANVCYVLAFMPQPDGNLIVAGRACGKRKDGQAFLADYVVPQVWTESYLWQPKAKERLDTFLNCDCAPRVVCSMHTMYLKQWQHQDMQRMALSMNTPLPEALEAILIAERAAQAAAIQIPR